MDIANLFNSVIPTALATHTATAQAIGGKFQFNIAGAGEWNVDLTKSGPTCNPGKGPADCTVSISAQDFEKVFENPEANAMKMFMFGKLKVSGNQMLGLKLKEIFNLVK